MDTIISYDEVAALVVNPPWIVRHLNITNLHNLRRHILQSLSNVMQIGMYVSLVVLMLKMDICPKHALPPGDGLITRRDLIGIMWDSSLRRGVMCAPKQCTRRSCQLWQCGAEQVELKCVKSFVSTPTLYPTNYVTMDDDNKTVVNSNLLTTPKLCAPSVHPRKPMIPITQATR